MNDNADQRTQTQPKHRRLKKLWWFVIPVVVLLVAGAAALVYVHVKDSAPLDKYARQVSFPMYYPSKLPPGYMLDPESIKIAGDLVIFRLTSTDKKPTLVFTEQTLPKDFDTNKLVGKDATALAVYAGTLYDLSAAEQGKFMLTTSSTLVFINATDKIDPTLVNALATTMRQVNN